LLHVAHKNKDRKACITYPVEGNELRLAGTEIAGNMISVDEINGHQCLYFWVGALDEDAVDCIVGWWNQSFGLHMDILQKYKLG